MANRNKIPFGVLAFTLVLFVYSICMIIHALVTGEIRGKVDWIQFGDDPQLFRYYVSIYVFVAVSVIGGLWLLHKHPRR